MILRAWEAFANARNVYLGEMNSEPTAAPLHITAHA
jgi:hypothetical protein